jgi:tetratricopeptide (TPR) repeat protein
MLRPLLLAATSKTSEERMESKAVMEKFASPEACALWEKAARLDPTNYIVIAYWGWLEAVPALMKAEAPLVALAGGRRTRLVEAMSMLERLGDHPNAQLAAGSLETLGILRFVTSLQGPEARTAFRRAVTLDPERTQAWQGLIAFNFGEKNYQELVSICEERLKHEGSAQNQIDAAKACVRAGLLEKAMGHGEAAVKLAPDDPAAQISLAALLLLRFGPDGDLTEAKKHLTRALELGKTVQDAERGEALAYANGVNLAIFLTLAGDAEAARKILDDVDRIDSLSEDQHTHVSEVRVAIGK